MKRAGPGGRVPEIERLTLSDYLYRALDRAEREWYAARRWDAARGTYVLRHPTVLPTQAGLFGDDDRR